MTQLVRLIYASTVSPEVDRAALEAILNDACQRNRAWGISGVLYFNRHYFVQCMEGGQRAVNRLFQIISVDSRHSEVELLAYTRIDARLFGNWGMGYLPETATTQLVLQPYFAHSAYDPYRLAPEDALSMLVDLCDVYLRDGVTIRESTIPDTVATEECD